MPKITIKPKTTINTTNKTDPNMDTIKTTLETKVAETTLPLVKPTEVIPAADINASLPNEVELPRHLFTGFADVLREQMVIVATQIAEKYLPNTPVEDVIKECVPDAPKVKTTRKTKKTTKAKKAKITDFKEATCLEDLKAFKIPELKDICSAHNLPVTGSKKLLMARVWGITHPDEAPKEEKKKRGRKPGSGKKAPVTVEVEDSAEEMAEEEEFELDPDNMESIYLTTDGKVVDKDSDGAKEYKLKMKFLFLEKEDSFDFAGTVENNVVTFMEDPPDELLKLLGSD